MKLLALLGAACTVLGTHAQAQETNEEIASPTVRELAEIETGRADALRLFWAAIEANGAPLIEEVRGDDSLLVTFVYRDPDAQGVRLQSNINALLIEGIEADFDRLGLLERLDGTDLWYVSIPVPKDVRAPYIFQVSSVEGDGETQAALDPYNPKKLWPESRFAWSVVELPGAEPQPWVEERPGVERGEWTELSVESEALGGEQTVWVYTPGGYDATRSEPYDVLIGLSVPTFRHAIPAGLILDNLAAAGEFPATVGIVADIGGRESEERSYAPTLEFIAAELLPALREQYNLAGDPDRVTVAGTSRRGMVATYLALSRPDIIGNVIALSASYYWRPPGYTEYEWLTRLYAEREKAALKLYVAAGSLENVVTPNNRGHYMLATNRHMRDVLAAKGYDFEYVEFGGVHHELSWQGELANGLISLGGRR